MGDDAGEVDVAGWEGLAVRLGLSEQAILDQPFEADEHRIARKRGKTLVRRVAVARRPERQHLPQALAGGREKLDELEGAGPEIPDAELTRQRCRAAAFISMRSTAR